VGFLSFNVKAFRKISYRMMNTAQWHWVDDRLVPIEQAAASPPPERKAVLGTSESLGSFLNFGKNRAETPTAAIQLYEKSSAVSIPINKISEPFASIVPVLQFREKIITDHEVLDLLQYPSPNYDGYTFIENLGKYVLIAGEAGLVALGGITRPPLELQPITPASVSPSEGKGGIASNFIISGTTLAGEYRLSSKRGETRYFNGNLREFKQIRTFSTKNNGLLRGQSPLISAAAEARQHILGNNHNTSLLEKGGRLSLVFHFADDMQLDDFNEAKRRVVEQYGGAQNAGQIAVTAGEKLDIHEFGVNNKDMDYVKMQRMAMDSVALQYNCPLPLISNQSATFNNYGTAQVALYDNAVLPLADRVYAALSAFLLPRYGIDPKEARITYDILSIPVLRTRVLEEIKTRKDINIESDNELRPLMARDPYKGGDVVLKPANLIPAGSDFLIDEPQGIPENEEDTE
jgi:HK97 family phage portal protein